MAPHCNAEPLLHWPIFIFQLCSIIFQLCSIIVFTKLCYFDILKPLLVRSCSAQTGHHDSYIASMAQIYKTNCRVCCDTEVKALNKYALFLLALLMKWPSVWTGHGLQRRSDGGHQQLHLARPTLWPPGQQTFMFRSRTLHVQHWDLKMAANLATLYIVSV